MPAVLIIEDEPAIADALIYALKTENFSVTHVTTAQEGLDHFNSHAPDFAVLDIERHVIDGDQTTEFFCDITNG